MNKEFQMRANDSAERMARAGMTLSSDIMLELIAHAQQLEEQNTAQTSYIRFLEAELMQVNVDHASQQAQEPSLDTPPLRTLRANLMALAGEVN